jgi:hypothetical protein
VRGLAPENLEQERGPEQAPSGAVGAKEFLGWLRVGSVLALEACWQGVRRRGKTPAPANTRISGAFLAAGLVSRAVD